MDKKQPSATDDVIRKSHKEVDNSTSAVEKELADMLAPHRDWSPVPMEHSTSTAYSSTDLNNTAQDHSTRTAFSPASQSPAMSSGSTAYSRTPEKTRRVSPNRGHVLTEQTRSRPSVRRSDLVNSNRQAKNRNNASMISVEMPLRNSRSPATAISRDASVATAGSIQGTPASRNASQKSTRSGGSAKKPMGRLFPASGTTSANRSINTAVGVTPQPKRTPGSSGSAAAVSTPASRLGGSAKSVRTAMGPSTPASQLSTAASASRMSTAAAATPCSRLSTATSATPASRLCGSAKSVRTAMGPATPASRNVSQRSTRTAVGNTPNPGPAPWQLPGTTPTSRPPIGSSAKSTRTALSASANRPVVESLKSAKSTKTALSSATPGNRLSSVRTPASRTAVPPTRNNTPASKNSTPSSSKSANGDALTTTPRRRPVESSKSLRNKRAAQSNSTTTAITPGGLSAVTARSISPAPLSGTLITLNSATSPTRTAVPLSYPNTPESGFRAERNGLVTGRSRSLTPDARVEKSMTSTAKETRPHERTIAALHAGSVFGRSKAKPEEKEMSPLKIIETTSFSRTPQQSILETAVAPASTNLSFHSPKSSSSMYTAITPNGLDAITARSIPATSSTSGVATAKPISSASCKSSLSQKKGARKSLMPKVQVTLPNKSTKSVKSKKSAKSGKSVTFDMSVKSQNAKAEKKSKAVSKKGLSKLSASTAKSFPLPNTPKTARDIEPEMLEEARGQQGQIVVTNALPDGSFKVVVQLTVKVASGGRAALAGRAPQGMVTKKVAVNGASIYQG